MHRGISGFNGAAAPAQRALKRQRVDVANRYHGGHSQFPLRSGMTTNSNPPEEPAPSEKGAVLAPASLDKDALSGVDRLLSPDDLVHPGTQKLVLSRLDKAESDLRRLEPLRELCSSTKTELAVAKEQLKAARDTQDFRAILNTLGGLFMGMVPAVTSIVWLTIVLFLVASLMLGVSWLKRAETDKK